MSVRVDVTPASDAPYCETVDHVFPLRHVQRPSRHPQPYRQSSFSGAPCVCFYPSCIIVFLWIESSTLVFSAIKLLRFCHCRNPAEWFGPCTSDAANHKRRFQLFAASSLTCSFHIHCRGGVPAKVRRSFGCLVRSTCFHHFRFPRKRYPGFRYQRGRTNPSIAYDRCDTAYSLRRCSHLDLAFVSRLMCRKLPCSDCTKYLGSLTPHRC